MGRQRKKIAFIGDTGTGKSTQVVIMIKHRCEKYNEACIILDPNNQTIWKQFASINLELLKRLKKGIYRIVTSEFEQFFDIIYNHCQGIQVVCEDSTDWAKPHENKKITKVLIALRHPDHDCDVTFIMHTVYRCPDYIFEQLHEVILFKTGDSWDDIKHKIPENKREMFKEAFYRVQNHSSKHYFERIILKTTSDLEEKKLHHDTNNV